MGETKAKRRTVRGWAQVEAWPPAATFEVVQKMPGDNRWHTKIADMIGGDRPEFECPDPKGSPYTPQQVANKAAGELNEAYGYVTLTRYRDGIPVGSYVFATCPRLGGMPLILCWWSTDPDQPAEHPDSPHYRRRPTEDLRP